MSGQAALAAARKRRVNVPMQQLGNSLDIQYKTQEPPVNEATNNIRVSLHSVVRNHELKLNILKKELDNLAVSKNSENNNLDNLLSESSIASNNQNIKDISEKVDSIKLENGKYSEDLKTLNNQFVVISKELENFKGIFLNINKVLNELKSQSDSSVGEIENIKSFLNENNVQQELNNKVEIEVKDK